MEEFSFSIPSKRNVVEENPAPIMTLEFSGEAKTGRKIYFNKAACELLKFECDGNDMFGLDVNNPHNLPVVANVTENKEKLKEADLLTVSKGKPHGCNNAKWYNTILNYFAVTGNTGKFEFSLSVFEGYEKVYVISPMFETTVESDSQEQDEEAHTEHGSDLDYRSYDFPNSSERITEESEVEQIEEETV